ncbi:hypothetical protein [Streptomyces vinaceus]|uniref:hypothetical protein n=1 Tax=Streptomyces vinaceus TaxID=1960 RepID=UPI0037FA39A8
MISVSAEGPRGRKEYTLTDEGLAGFLGVLTPEQARGYLTELTEMSEQEYEGLRQLEASIDWGDDPHSVHGRIALEYGLRFNAMRREWALWSASQIR